MEQLAPPVRVYGPRQPAPRGARPVNATSRSSEPWSRGLSPFYLGPVTVRPGDSRGRAKTVENGWQYSKVYPGQTVPGPSGAEEPGLVHALWALEGWNNPKAVRYPKGRGARPLFSLHRGRRLSYAAARLYIYVPLYLEGLCVSAEGRAAYARLAAEHAAAAEEGASLALFDFDGYDHHRPQKPPLPDGAARFAAVLLDEKKKAGHAFILAALLDGTFAEGYRRALEACPGARALAAGGCPPPPLPDLAPLRAAEGHAPYAQVGAGVFCRQGFLGVLADGLFAALLPEGGAGVPWARRQVQIFGWKEESRQTAFYGDAGLHYRYSGRDNEALPWEADPTGALLMARDLTARATGETANFCLLSLYEGLDRALGKHSDDEAGLAPGSAIAAVSLGARRRFGLEPKSGTGSSAAPLAEAVYPVAHGALIVMKGATQRLFRHWVFPGSARQGDEDGPRISLTFRTVL
jgi:alkylated DNA repair dioxygenase AlkB